MTFPRLAALGILLVASNAQASTLYSNGPVNGHFNSWLINLGSAFANTFTLAYDSTITGANFAVWNLPDNVTTQVEWAITASPSAGPVIATGVASVSSTPLFHDVLDVNLDSITIPDLSLAAGTYWFQLQNAVSSKGSFVFWDINNGPSSVWSNDFGYIDEASCASRHPGGTTCSNTFELFGTSSDLPEPMTLSLLGFGLAGLLLNGRTKSGSTAS